MARAGTKGKSFEDEWCNFTGARHSIAVTSCTSALHLSLAALDFKEADEAIVPAFTWISTANVIEHLGGKVKFVDIDLQTFNIDPKQIEKAITSKTKAILPVHLFGLSADMDRIKALSEAHNLRIVEDAACGFGSKYKKLKHVEILETQDALVFIQEKPSLLEKEVAITTQDDSLADKLRKLRDHGASLSDRQRHLGSKPYLLADHPYAGFNQRMTDIQGSLGLAQMARASDIISERRNIAKKYNHAFADLSYIRLPNDIDQYTHSYQSYPCLYKPNEVFKALRKKSFDEIEKIFNDRNKWMEKLQDNGISTRPSTHAVHMLDFYKKKYNIKPENFPNAMAANNCSISLPLFNGMQEKEQDFVINNIKMH